MRARDFHRDLLRRRVHKGLGVDQPHPLRIMRSRASTPEPLPAPSYHVRVVGETHVMIRPGGSTVTLPRVRFLEG